MPPYLSCFAEFLAKVATEVNVQTMESKLVSNPFFVGEMLDVDGDRRGFNFHFAWVTGMRVRN